MKIRRKFHFFSSVYGQGSDKGLFLQVEIIGVGRGSFFRQAFFIKTQDAYDLSELITIFNEIRSMETRRFGLITGAIKKQ